jgi:hypothetical protein
MGAMCWCHWDISVKTMVSTICICIVYVRLCAHIIVCIYMCVCIHMHMYETNIYLLAFLIWSLPVYSGRPWTCNLPASTSQVEDCKCVLQHSVRLTLSNEGAYQRNPNKMSTSSTEIFFFFLIYSYVLTLFGPFLPPTPSSLPLLPPFLAFRQNLFCPYL